MKYALAAEDFIKNKVDLYDLQESNTKTEIFQK